MKHRWRLLLKSETGNKYACLVCSHLCSVWAERLPCMCLAEHIKLINEDEHQPELPLWRTDEPKIDS